MWLTVVLCHFVNFRSSYSDFAAKYGKEDRFRGIEKTRERESLFADFLVDLRYKEKEESRNQKEKVLVLFNGILFVISEARLRTDYSRVTLVPVVNCDRPCLRTRSQWLCFWCFLCDCGLTKLFGYVSFLTSYFCLTFLILSCIVLLSFTVFSCI